MRPSKWLGLVIILTGFVIAAKTQADSKPNIEKMPEHLTIQQSTTHR